MVASNRNARRSRAVDADVCERVRESASVLVLATVDKPVLFGSLEALGFAPNPLPAGALPVGLVGEGNLAVTIDPQS